MARSRRAKSQSVSSNPSEPQINGSMPPPSPPAIRKASPNLTRHRKTPATSPMLQSSPLAVAKSSSRSGTHLPSAPAHKPGVLQYILVAVLASFIEAGLQSVASQFGSGDLASISKHSESWVAVGGLLGWKFFTLGIMWFGGFDAYDVASLTLLLRTPTLILLYFFYIIHPTTLLVTTASSVASVALPFLIFRPLIPQHNPKSHHQAPRSLLRNKSILTDPYTTISTSLLATAIFTVILELTFQTFLPTWLITTFSPGIRSLDFAHAGPKGLPILLLALIPAGYACLVFLFTPSTGVTDLTENRLAFDPATAGFISHLSWNIWGWYTARQKELISRTIVLGGLVLIETIVETWGEVQGVEFIGAVGYAGIWAAATTVVGIVLEWVGGPSD